MTDAVIAAFGVTDADLLGSGWESTIYALGKTQVLRIPRPGAAAKTRFAPRQRSRQTCRHFPMLCRASAKLQGLMASST